MPSIIKSNVSVVVSSNQAKRAAFMDGAANAIYRATNDFKNKIQDERMHRQATGVGTNVVTGMLRRDWFNLAIRENQTIKALVWSTTPYAPIHEDGGAYEIPGGTVKAFTRKGGVKVRSHWRSGHFVHYKSVLGIGEAWEKDFLPMMEKQLIAMAAKTLQ